MISIIFLTLSLLNVRLVDGAVHQRSIFSSLLRSKLQLPLNIAMKQSKTTLATLTALSILLSQSTITIADTFPSHYDTTSSINLAAAETDSGANYGANSKILKGGASTLQQGIAKVWMYTFFATFSFFLSLLIYQYHRNRHHHHHLPLYIVTKHKYYTVMSFYSFYFSRLLEG